MFALIGMVFGGVLRLAPEVLKFFTAKADRAHEIEMARLQLERDRAQTDNKIREIGAQADADYDTKGLDALATAIAAQGRLTGHPFVDFVSQTVRPFLTYWWMALYTAVKLAILVTVWGPGTEWAHAVLIVWTEADMAVLGGIINFWFLDRVLKGRAARG